LLTVVDPGVALDPGLNLWLRESGADEFHVADDRRPDDNWTGCGRWVVPFEVLTTSQLPVRPPLCSGCRQFALDRTEDVA
jgi:hypothetical protein